MVDKSAIGFDQTGIANILNRYSLEVPANQREYAWKTEHVLNLFEDLSRAINDDEPTYFLGTIVTIQRGVSVEVVDGQQRLATTALLLRAIANHLSTREPIIANYVEGNFLSTVDISKVEHVLRLKLNRVDNSFFETIITGKDRHPIANKPSHRLISQTMELAEKQVKNIVAPFGEADHGAALTTWIKFLESKAVVVLLTVQDDANAYRMFETLNDRGLRVSQGDLIKNYLYGRAGSRLNEVQEKWTLIRGTLETLSDDDALVDFLRHGISVSEGFVRQAQLYEKVQRTAGSPSKVVEFSDTLEKLAAVYVAIQNPEHEFWNGHLPTTRKAIVELNLFDIKPMRPIMLSAATKMSTKECAATFRFLVNLGVRLIIASSTRTGSIEQALSGAARSVYNGEVRTAVQLKKNLKDILPSDEAFADAFARAKISNAKFARYYLRSLEKVSKESQDQLHEPVDDATVANLEHILPKRSLGNWPQFGDAEEAREYVTRLGNQALLMAADNSALGSAAFGEKRGAFEASPYRFTLMVSEVDQWTSDEIDDRQREMASVAVKAWPL